MVFAELAPLIITIYGVAAIINWSSHDLGIGSRANCVLHRAASGAPMMMTQWWLSRTHQRPAHYDQMYTIVDRTEYYWAAHYANLFWMYITDIIANQMWVCMRTLCIRKRAELLQFIREERRTLDLQPIKLYCKIIRQYVFCLRCAYMMLE